MSVWPDWNSVESTATWSDRLFWAGIVCLVLLAITEVGSHILGKRSQGLIDAANHARAVERERAEKAAQEQHAADTAALRAQVAGAEQRATKLAEQAAPRALTPEDQRELTRALSPFAGQRATLSVTLGDSEARAFADQLLAVLRSAKWEATGVDQSIFVGPVWGVQVSVKGKSEAEGPTDQRLLPPLNALVTGLHQFGLMERGAWLDETTEDGTIRIVIGAKPRDHGTT